MKLEFLMEYTITLNYPPPVNPDGPFGNRRIYTFTGGSFEGPELKGKVLPSGGDWLLRGADGIGRVDYRATLETGDGAQIYLQLYGIVRADPSRPARSEGEPAEYGDRYYMVTPRFETGDERYAWLNGLVCVGEGKPVSGGVAHRVFAVIND